MAFSDVIARLAVSLSLDTAAFTTGSRKAQAEVGGLQGKFAGLGKGVGLAAGAISGALAGIGLSNLIGQAFDMASALSEDAEKLGLTVEGLQELRFAADQSGVSQENLGTAIIKLNRSMGDLEMGKKAAVDAFAAIGLSADDLKGKNPQEVLGIIADALNKLPDPQQRVAVGAQLMGRNFSELIPLISGGSAALDDWKQKAIQNGEITTQDAKNLDAAADAWSRFKTVVVTATANVVAGLLPMSQKIGEFLDATRAFFAGVHDKIVAFVRDALDAVTRFGKAITDFFHRYNEALGGGTGGKTKAAFVQFADEGGLQLTSFANTAEAVSVRVQKTFKDMADATLGALDKLATAVKGGGFLGILSAVVGLGLQLGSIGAFGSTIAGRINNPAGTLPGNTKSPGIPSLGGGGTTLASLGGGGTRATSTVQVVPSPYFNVVVDGRIQGAAPAIASAGGQVGVQNMLYRSTRRVA